MLQSQLTKNGQQLNVAAGGGAIARNDVVEIGGPGAQAWTAATADYAAISLAGIVSAEQSVVAAAMGPATRQALARDRLGNIYIAGTNTSGNLVIYKYNALGTLLASAILDATATVVASPIIFQLQTGAFAAVYARATGALMYVVFDAGLALLSGPISVVTERAATNVVYHSACALNGGGFAIVYQSSAATALRLQTFANDGTAVLAATTVQVLAGSAAQEFLRLGQLSNGNLVLAYRGAMTAGGIAGLSVNIFSPAGVAVIGPVNVDTTATLGLLELSIMAGNFAVAQGNGTNLIAAVFNNAGAQQGSNFSVGNTLNVLTQTQVKLTNDGTRFWLAWLSSVGAGLFVVSLSTTGASGTAANSLGSQVAATGSLDAAVINGNLVALVASTTTGGQKILNIGLPDASLGTIAPALRVPPITFGSSSGSTGSFFPRILSGGEGLYLGAGGPNSQPASPLGNGDWTGILCYEHASATLLGVYKVENSAIVGVALTAIGAGSNGSPVTVNPGQGEYESNTLGGSSGIIFNHLSVTPGGTSGTLFNHGIAMSGIATTALPTAPGLNTQVVYNKNGSFAAAAGLTFNDATNALTAANFVGLWNSFGSPQVSIVGGGLVFNFGGWGFQTLQCALAGNGTQVTFALPVVFTAGIAVAVMSMISNGNGVLPSTGYDWLTGNNTSVTITNNSNSGNIYGVMAAGRF